MSPSAQLEPFLELRNIRKSFGGVKAVVDGHLTLRGGEVHALVGENGAGKTTLVKVITGVHQPDQGDITFQGEPMTIQNPIVARHLGIAAIYQEVTLCPDLSVAENIFIGHQPLRPLTRTVDWRQMNEDAAELLEQLEVEFNPRQKVQGLSIAEMQVVEIAKALSYKANVIVMDEPTSSLTMREAAELFRVIEGLREAGKAVLFISHRLDEVFEIADRVTVMRNGRHIDTRDVEDVTQDDIIRMMVGRSVDNMFLKQDVEPGEIVLKVENLSKKGVFNDVSFELRRGEILGMAGLVGAGRTDVGLALFGLLRPDKGKIWVNGRQVTIKGPQHAMKLGLAYVPEDRQQQGLLLPMSITKNITLPILSNFTTMTWVNSSAEANEARSMAQQMEVKYSSLDQCARELSGGNQQKVVLAKWLAPEPDILILDEPTRGIDVGTKAAVHELMGELAAQGNAILMISSELPEILGMSDRVLVMCGGEVTGHFSRQEATQEKILLTATAAGNGELEPGCAASEGSVGREVGS